MCSKNHNKSVNIKLACTTVLDAELVTRCSRCGKCRSVCPVFEELRAEPYVARGKVQLYKALLNGTLEATEKYRELISFCLLCGRCTENCPNGVNTGEIVLRARNKLVDSRGLPFIKRNVFQHLLKNNGRLTWAAGMLHIYQRWGLQSLVRKTGLLPGPLKDREQLLPVMADKPLRSQLPAVINPPGRVRVKAGYFTGCLSQYIYTETGKNVANILTRAGAQVVIPEQYCCGMPALTAGDKVNALALARMNVAAFSAAGVDVVITDCATCGSALYSKYPELLGEDLPFKVMDICQFLAQWGTGAEQLNSANARAATLQNDIAGTVQNTPVVPGHASVSVTYHDPCHLARYMQVREEPRTLLRGIPGMEFTEMSQPDRCCGASGSFQLEHQELAARIGEHKIKSILATGARVVATGCPSCRLQLARLLQASNAGIAVVHPVDLLI
ncbi:(Fe-S)-binding protein [Desulfoscipio gibsoniae]|uniref:Glycolate oxidase iron-sulfur subunit n=1 Tax=Desulfoscipio gibsoniae DSM 7213 TaxID=767817 RepID=R4KHM1_9FIRM|nr:heterodisulfide reductase-related iron-sulfur binding cluster [Desulfoscipio gibsoniae]AGL02104.1 Fe-S oxidoreductase [Desulfoscipio gibsoniae DSM 7213]